MPRPNKGPRLYTRQQGGHRRYYADLRSVGRGRVALIPEGDSQATTDPVIAQKMLAELLREIQETKRDRHLLGVKRRVGMAAYAEEHLTAKAKSRKVRPETLGKIEQHLRTAITYFGAEREVASIEVDDVQAFTEYLSMLENGRGGTLGPATQRRYLSSLSNLFKRAQGEKLVPPGYNPVAAMMDKPIGQPGESAWLEVWEAALLLEAARTYPYDGPADATAAQRLRRAIAATLGVGEQAEAEFLRRMRAVGMRGESETLAHYLSGQRIPTKRYLLAAADVLELPEERLYRRHTAAPRPDRSAYPLIATYLLTGARETEAYGLQLGDVNLKRTAITFRENAYRKLKTRTSFRTVPYWPQLREILEPHLERRRAEGAGPDDLVFISQRTGQMLSDTRKTLDAIAARAGWRPGEIRSKMFRHTYCATRLQTLDRGHPVATYTVARELGHGGSSLVERVYSHLGAIPHRAEVVEYRIEQQQEAIPPERLRQLIRAS